MLNLYLLVFHACAIVSFFSLIALFVRNRFPPIKYLAYAMFYYIIAKDNLLFILFEGCFDISFPQIGIDDHADAVMTELLGKLGADAGVVATDELASVTRVSDRILVVSLVKEGGAVACIDVRSASFVVHHLRIHLFGILGSLVMWVGVGVAGLNELTVNSHLGELFVHKCSHSFTRGWENQSVPRLAALFDKMKTNDNSVLVANSLAGFESVKGFPTRSRDRGKPKSLLVTRSICCTVGGKDPSVMYDVLLLALLDAKLRRSVRGTKDFIDRGEILGMRP